MDWWRVFDWVVGLLLVAIIVLAIVAAVTEAHQRGKCEGMGGKYVDTTCIARGSVIALD